MKLQSRKRFDYGNIESVHEKIYAMITIMMVMMVITITILMMIITIIIG